MSINVMSDPRAIALFDRLRLKKSDPNYLSQDMFAPLFQALLDEITPKTPARSVVPAKPARTYSEDFKPRDQLPEVVDSRNQGQFLTRSFSHIHTGSIVDAFEQMGWGVFDGKGTYNLGIRRNARGLESGRTDDTGRHMLTFRPFNTDGLIEVGKRIVQAYLINAHDGTTKLQFNLGTCEYVCSNGAMVQRAGFALALRHMGLTLEHVIRSFTALLNNASVMLEQSRILEALPVTENQALEFARRAIPIRWEENQPEPALLLTAAYAEQKPLTMYNVHQNVQRNLMYPDFTLPSSTKSGQRKATTVRGLDKIVNINTGLDLLLGDYMSSEFPNVELPVPTDIGAYENPIEA